MRWHETGRWLRLRWIAAVYLCPLLFAGCGDAGNEAALAAAQQSVRTALEAWQRGESPVALNAAPTAIEFFDDDWNRSARLLEFEIFQTYMETDRTPRCAVALSIQAGEQPQEKIQVTYQVVAKDGKVVIARDPFS